VFENRVLRRIFGPKKDEVMGVRRELHNLNFSSNKIKVIKSRRVRWAGHIARIGRIGICIGFLWESQKKETTRKT
jgi:hypothetical protein